MVEYAHAGMYGPGTFEDAHRNLMESAPITVYNRGTVVLATLYTDRTKTTTSANPFTTDSRGNGYFYANPGEYDVSYAGISLPVSVPLDPADMATELPPGATTYKYKFSTLTADSDPGSNTLRFNNATQASTTRIFVDNLSAAGVDLSSLYPTLDDSTSAVKAIIELLSPNGANLAVFNLTGAVVDGTGYFKLPVTFVSGNLGFLNNQDVYLRFTPIGNKGDPGSPGAPGSNGLPTGGSTHQALVKASGSDRDVEWFGPMVPFATSGSPGSIEVLQVTDGSHTGMLSYDTSFSPENAFRTTDGVWAGDDVRAHALTTSQVIIGDRGPGNEPGILFGEDPARSTIYLVSDHTIRTDADLQAASLRVNDAFSLPVVDGAVHQTMKTNGAGVVSWADNSYAGAIAIPYTFSTTTTDSDPGNGVLRLNTATQSSTTVIRTDLLDNTGANQQTLLDTFDDSTSTVKGHIRISDPNDPSAFLTFAVTAVATPTGYRNISVTLLASSSANPFANGQKVVLYFTPKGDKGDLLTTQSWVSFSAYGVVKDSSTNNTTAINAAISEAVTIGAAGCVDDVLPVTVGNQILISGRSDFLNKFLMGMGEEFTIFRCTASGAGIDFNAYGNTVLYGGGGVSFSVFGGPYGSPGVATRPMTVGLLTMPYFRQVRTWNALSGADGVCLLLAACQNGQFDTIWCGGGDVALRFDAGSSANIFMKPEISAAAINMVEYRSNLTSPAGQQAYTVYNELVGGIIEAPLSTTVHMIRSTAGALNALRSMTLSVNAPAFGGTNPTGMASMISVETSESSQASMIVNQCKLNGGSVSGICGIDSVLTGTNGAARVHVSDGSMGAMALGGKGVIMIGHPTPWFFSTVTQKWDSSGITTVIPHFERSAREFFKADGGSNDIVTVSQVTGEANVRYFDQADGSRVLGPGSASTDCSIGRIGTNNSKGVVGNITGYLGSISSAYNGNHRVMGSIHEWYDTGGNLRAFSSAPTATTDGVPVGGYLSQCTWNGIHVIWGGNHIWFDATGAMRRKASAPTFDTDGTVVG